MLDAFDLLKGVIKSLPILNVIGFVAVCYLLFINLKILARKFKSFSDRSNEHKPGVEILWRISFTVVIICFIYYWTFSLIFPKSDWSSFGDLFGPLNSLFSGLAFGILIYTLLMQKEELGLQRTQIGQQTAQLSYQKDELENHRKEFQINRMSNMVYQQVYLFNDFMKLTRIRTTQNIELELLGREGLVWILSQMEDIDYLPKDRSNQFLGSYSILYHMNWMKKNHMEIMRVIDSILNSSRILQINFQGVIDDPLSNISKRDLDKLKDLYFSSLSLEVDHLLFKIEQVFISEYYDKSLEPLGKQIKDILDFRNFTYTKVTKNTVKKDFQN